METLIDIVCVIVVFSIINKGINAIEAIQYKEVRYYGNVE